MFLVDKYNNHINEINNKIYNNIYNNISGNKINHMIIHGRKGSNHTLLVNNILFKLFDKAAFNVKTVEYIISGYSNTKTSVFIKQSKNHIIIEPNNNGFDKYIIQDIVQNYAKMNVLNIFENKLDYKIVLINKIDNLSYFAQASLRRTMETCSDTCKFILISEQLSKIIEPLRSRCWLLRLPTPSKIDILNTILKISHLEKINLSIDDFKKIIKNCDYNINNALWLLDAKKKNLNLDQNWHLLINNIIDIILNSNKKTINILEKLRENLYLLFITNIKSQEIIKKIMKTLLTNINNISLKYEIINITSIFEYRISIGTRYIIHLEAYLLKIINLLKTKKDINYLEELEI
jgi:replication factor C subunit 3/5